MSKKFEQLLDYLVNEEMDKANELFHEIVVEKSREIYENMIAEETAEDVEEDTDAEGEGDQQEESYADDSENESVEEEFMPNVDDDETSMSIGGDNDPGDSLPSDVEDPHAGDDNEDVSSGEEQIIDILQQLKSEFEDIVAKHSGEEPEAAVATTGDDEEDDGEDDGEGDDEEGGDEEPKYEEESMGQPMREYVENVGMNWEKNSMKTPGPVGSGKGDLAGQTSVDGGMSPVSKGKGKPVTGADAGNILGSKKTDGTSPTGTTPTGKAGGLAGNVKGEFTNSGTHNVNNVKSGVKTLSKVAQNSKSPSPVGAGSGDKAGQTSVSNNKSPLMGAPNRNA